MQPVVSQGSSRCSSVHHDGGGECRAGGGLKGAEGYILRRQGCPLGAGFDFPVPLRKTSMPMVR